MAETSLHVGFIGTGLMGAPMARRLLRAGLPVTVWNRSPEKSAALALKGAAVAATPAGLAEVSDVVCLCVSDTAAVEAVVFGEHGVASARAGDKVLVDFSSIRPDATAGFAARLQSGAGMRWIDAPVSGGVKGAKEGTLILLCGGDVRDIEAVAPVLSAVASRWTHMGTVGAGQATKLCNQVIVSANLVAIAEAMLLGRAAGIDVARLPQALAGGWADSLPLEIIGPRMADPGTTGRIGSLATMLKDIDSALAAAGNAAGRMAVARCAAETVREACAAGLGDEDLSAIAKWLGLHERAS